MLVTQLRLSYSTFKIIPLVYIYTNDIILKISLSVMLCTCSHVNKIVWLWNRYIRTVFVCTMSIQSLNIPNYTFISMRVCLKNTYKNSLHVLMHVTLWFELTQRVGGNSYASTKLRFYDCCVVVVYICTF